jgi:hypothetical protein
MPQFVWNAFHRRPRFYAARRVAGFLFYLSMRKQNFMSTTIFLQLGKENLAASVTEVNHPQHAMFHVVMEDGYENIFFSDVETGEWIEEDLGHTALAQKIGNEIEQQVKVSKPAFKQLTWHKELDDDGVLLHFGAFEYRYGKNHVYEIFRSNRKFLCYLLQTSSDQWLLLEPYNNVISKEDIDMVERLPQVLINEEH